MDFQDRPSHHLATKIIYMIPYLDPFNFFFSFLKFALKSIHIEQNQRNQKVIVRISNIKMI